MESVYLDYQRLSEDAARENVDVGFAKIADALRENGVAYQFVNEKVLEKLGGVREGRLVVGKCAYSAVVLANCRELKENTVRLLTSYLKAVSYTHLDVYKRQIKAKENIYIEVSDMPESGMVGTAVTLPEGKVVQACLLYTSRCV